MYKFILFPSFLVSNVLLMILSFALVNSYAHVAVSNTATLSLLTVKFDWKSTLIASFQCDFWHFCKGLILFWATMYMRSKCPRASCIPTLDWADAIIEQHLLSTN